MPYGSVACPRRVLPVRYLVLLKMDEAVGPPPPALGAAMGELTVSAVAAGTMVDAGGLAPMAQSTEIAVRAGSVLVTDGPYTEAKEIAGGYAILEVPDAAAAVAAARQMIDLHVRHWPGWEGAAEVRPLVGPPAP
jgi:hypothetical protein